MDAHREGGGADRRGQVGVVEDDCRGLAAELEEDLLDRLGGGRHHLAPGRGRPRERHQVDARVRLDSIAPASWERLVTTLNTPAGMSVCSATSRPSSAATQGVSGAGLSTTVLPAASAGATLARLIWFGKFHGVIAATTPTASRRRCAGCGCPSAWPPRGPAPRRSRREGPRSRPTPSTGYVVLRAGGEERGSAHLGGGEGAHRLAVVHQRPVELLDAVPPEVVVGRPRRLVEGAPGGVERGRHVGGAGVRCLTDDLLGGRVDDVEQGTPVAGAGELAVDQQLGRRVRQRLGRAGHASPRLLVSPTWSRPLPITGGHTGAGGRRAGSAPAATDRRRASASPAARGHPRP